MGDNLGTTFLSSTWAEFGICTVVLAARYYTRARIVRKWAADDFFMIISYLLALTDSIITTISVHYGTGQHQETLSHENGIQAQKYSIIGQPIGILAKTFGRIAWAMTLYILLSPQQRWQRYLLQVVVAVQIVANVSITIFIYAQCHPIDKLWDHDVPGTCLPPMIQEYYGFTESSVAAASDLVLILFPLPLIWNLNMKASIKISLILTMAFGIVSLVASIVKTVYLKTLSSVNDMSYETTYLLIWFSLEQYAVIVTATVPTLRPMFARMYFSGLNGETMVNNVTANRVPRYSRRDRDGTLSRIDSDQLELTEALSAIHYELAADQRQKNEADQSSITPPAELGGIVKTVDVEVTY